MKHFREKLYEDYKGVVGILNPENHTEYHNLVEMMMRFFCEEVNTGNHYDPTHAEQKVLCYSFNGSLKQPVGYSLVEDREKEQWIDHIFVWKAYRRNGVATDILEQVIEVAKGENIRKVSALVIPDSVEGKRLFSKAGFKRKGIKEQNRLYRMLL